MNIYINAMRQLDRALIFAQSYQISLKNIEKQKSYSSFKFEQGSILQALQTDTFRGNRKKFSNDPKFECYDLDI